MKGENIELEQEVIISKSISASKWSVVSQFIQVINPLSLLILINILEPEDFGIFAVATLVVTFAGVLWDFGLSKAIIQKENDIDSASNVVFLFNTVIGLIIYALIFLSSDIIALVYSDVRLSSVLKVQGLMVIFNSISSIQITLFQRNLEFKPLFFGRLCTTIIPSIMQVILAYIGLSFWSLTLGALTGNVLQTFTLWLLNSWRPRIKFDFIMLKSLISYGKWVTVEFFLGWLIHSIDEIILGAFLGLDILGIYRTGKNLVSMVFEVTFGALPIVMFTAFSRMQNSIEDLKRTYNFTLKFHAIFVIPLGIILLFISPSITEILFNNRWTEIEKVLAILGLSISVSYLFSPNPAIYRAIGRADLQVVIILSQILFSIPLLLFLVNFGLIFFLFGQLGIQIISIPFHLFFMKKYIDQDYFSLLRELKLIIIASIFMIISMSLVTTLLISYNPYSQIFFRFTCGFFIYILTIIPERKQISHFLNIIFDK